MILQAAGRQESFSIDDIIEYDIMSYDHYGVYNETSFDGEGPLTTVANTISSGGAWALLFILVIPGALPVFGFIRWMRRRKL